MAKAIISGHIFLYVPMSTPEKPAYTFNLTDISGDLFIKVMPHTIEAEIPDDFDPVPAQIAALNEQEKAARLRLADELASINERRSKLQALTYEPA